MDKNDLQPFCSEDESRKGITQPWSEGEYSYATNGCILIRVPRLGDVPECDEAPKNVDKMFASQESRMGPEHALAALTFTVDEPTQCPECKGKGKVDNCPECYGTGEVHFGNLYNNYIVECASCGGGGIPHDPKCQVCSGTGKLEVVTPAKVGEAWFNATYLQLLKTLPDCKIGAPFPTPISPAYFHFVGGDGLLMPLHHRSVEE